MMLDPLAEMQVDFESYDIKQAIKFINGEISLNDWLSRFFAKQMNAYNKAIQQTRQTFINNNY